jgi:hypothetical protein
MMDLGSYVEDAVMTDIRNVIDFPAPTPARRERWLTVRDVLGGALLLAAWLAIWTVTWAAVAGPLRPADAVRAEAAAQLSRA